MVRTENLCVRLGDFELLAIRLEVEAGQYAVLLGPTGCGKTVLLETLVGINHPDSGTVWLDGVDVTHRSPERRGIGFVYQRSMLFPHLSVRRNIAYGLRYHGVARGARGERVGAVAELLGIGGLLDRGVGALSGGETQKVALARALAIRPRVLLLDEPLAALDPVGKETLRAELLALHRQTGTTILHVTHDQETARVLGQRIGVLNEGRLLQFGPKDEVFDRPNSPFVARFLGIENVFRGEGTQDGGLLRVELECGTVVTEAQGRGTVGLCVRPELIAIAPSDGDAAAPVRDAGSGRNHVGGVVESISDRGALVRYEVATVGERFVVLQTKKDYQSGGAAVGQPVDLSFEHAAVHVFSGRR